MSKDDFKVIRKESINIEEYRSTHERLNLIVETDPTKPGYGWIIHRGPSALDEYAFTTWAGAIDERCVCRENLIIIPAKIQRFPIKPVSLDDL